MIVSNSFMIGAEVNYMAVSGASTSPPHFYVAQHIYAVIFIMELLIRMRAYGCLAFFFGDQWPWHLFDSCLVMTSLLDVVLDVMVVSSDYGVMSVDNMTALRVSRIFRVTRVVRVFRITRIVRIVRFVQALRTLVHSILCTLRSVFWAMMLLLMIMYCFGVLITQAVVDYALIEDVDIAPELVQWWGSLMLSMYSLFKVISGGISWHDVVLPLETIGPTSAALFVVYVAFTHFAVLNVVTGVFCQSAIESAQRDQDFASSQLISRKKEVVAELRKLFGKVDEDCSGSITSDEFEVLLQDEGVQSYFAALELDASDASMLFTLLDTDRTEDLCVDEFVLGCLRMRGGAKGVDIARLLYENKRLMKGIDRFAEHVEKRLTRIDSYTSRKPEINCLPPCRGAGGTAAELLSGGASNVMFGADATRVASVPCKDGSWGQGLLAHDPKVPRSRCTL